MGWRSPGSTLGALRYESVFRSWGFEFSCQSLGILRFRGSFKILGRSRLGGSGCGGFRVIKAGSYAAMLSMGLGCLSRRVQVSDSADLKKINWALENQQRLQSRNQP